MEPKSSVGYALLPRINGTISSFSPPVRSQLPLPDHIIDRVAFYLQKLNAGGTLLNLLLISKSTYPIAGPYLYKDVYLGSKSFNSLFLGLMEESKAYIVDGPQWTKKEDERLAEIDAMEFEESMKNNNESRAIYRKGVERQRQHLVTYHEDQLPPTAKDRKEGNMEMKDTQAESDKEQIDEEREGGVDEEKEDPESDENDLDGQFIIRLNPTPLTLSGLIIRSTYPNEASHKRKTDLLRRTERLIILDVFAGFKIDSGDASETPEAVKVVSTDGAEDEADEELDDDPSDEANVTKHPREYLSDQLNKLAYAHRFAFNYVTKVVFAFPITNTIALWDASRKEDYLGTDTALDLQILAEILTILVPNPIEICVQCHPLDLQNHLCDYASHSRNLHQYLQGSLRHNMGWWGFKDWNVDCFTYHNVSFEAPPLYGNKKVRYYFIDCPLCHPLHEARYNFYLPRDQMREDQLCEIVCEDEDRETWDEMMDGDTPFTSIFEEIEQVEFIDAGRFQDDEGSPTDELKCQQEIAGECREEWRAREFPCSKREHKKKIGFKFAGNVNECECCEGLDLGYDWPNRRKRPTKK